MTKSLLVHCVSIDTFSTRDGCAHGTVHDRNMLHNGNLGNGGATDCNLRAFPLFDVLALAIPVFAFAVSWSLRFFFDQRRALWDATAVAVVSSI